MDAKRAAEVLRGDNDPSVNDLAVAAKIAAQALEAWAWVERTGEVPYEFGEGYCAPCVCASGDIGAGHGPTPLAAVLEAMEKEGKG